MKCRCCHLDWCVAFMSTNHCPRDTIFRGTKSIKESHVYFHSAFSNRTHMNFWSESEWTKNIFSTQIQQPKLGAHQHEIDSLVTVELVHVKHVEYVKWNAIRLIPYPANLYIVRVEHMLMLSELEKKCRKHVWQSVEHGPRIYRLKYSMLMQDVLIVCIAGSSIFIVKKKTNKFEYICVGTWEIRLFDISTALLLCDISPTFIGPLNAHYTLLTFSAA